MINFNQNIKSLIEYPKTGIISKDLGETEKYDSTLFCMAAGTKMSEHTSTKEGFVFVVEGNGVFTLEGKEIAMIPGVFIHMESNAVHALRAEEGTAFVLLLLK